MPTRTNERHPLIDRQAQHDLAARMTLRHFPTTLIRVQTGLSESEVSDLYRRVHNAAPPVPSTTPNARDLLATPEAVIKAAAFLSHYIRVAGAAAYRRINPDALIVAHDVHLASWSGKDGETPTASILRAWVLARDLRSRVLAFHVCVCGRDHLVHADHELAPCPFCGASAAALTRTAGKSITTVKAA